MSLATGQRLGPYEIVSLLRAGGIGEVYRARDTKLGRDVALKMLPESFTPEPQSVARFNAVNMLCSWVGANWCS